MRGSSGMPCGRDSEHFGLELHGVKTRLIEFGRYADEKDGRRRGLGRPETFKFLGFVFICGRARRGCFQLSASPGRSRAKLHEIKATLRKHLHAPLPEQGKWLQAVLNGYFAYHAVPKICDHCNPFASEWPAPGDVLSRRSQKARINWERMMRIADAWLPQPRILHPWPDRRFAANHPRWGAECLNWARSDLCGGAR